MMRDWGRKALKVMLAVAIGLGGLMAQTAETSLVAAERLAVDEASESMMRSLQAELVPESVAELQGEPAEADGEEVSSSPPGSVRR